MSYNHNTYSERFGNRFTQQTQRLVSKEEPWTIRAPVV
jgi:hypothetical protein